MDSNSELAALCSSHLAWTPPLNLVSRSLHRIPQPISATRGPTFTGILFGSERAMSCQYLINEDIEPFIQEAPEGYLLVGFWGYGMQSEAFYYSRVDRRARVLFRLPFGNVYTSRDEAVDVRAFLENWSAFEEAVAGDLGRLLAVDAMDTRRYEIQYSDGVTRQWPRADASGDSLLLSPDFISALGR